jgi:hypothetical protein
VFPEGGFLGSSYGFEGLFWRVTDLFGLEGGEVPDRGVGAFGVEVVDPVGGGGLDVVDVAPWALLVDQFGLV